MTKKQCYEILGISEGASEREIKEAYLTLVKVWHPDRFSNDPKLKAKASEKLKEINNAYERICKNEFTNEAAFSDGSDFVDIVADLFKRVRNNSSGDTNRGKSSTNPKDVKDGSQMSNFGNSRNITIDKGAVLIDSVGGVFLQRGINCIIKTDFIEIESKHGSLSVATNKITQIQFFPHYKESFWGQKRDGVDAHIRGIDGSVIKGKLLTEQLLVDYPNGIINGQNEIDCTQLKMIVGKQI